MATKRSATLRTHRPSKVAALLMKTRTWPILTAAFGTLLLLIALFVFGTLRRAADINAELDAVHQGYQGTEQFLNEVQSDFYLSNILVRDLALDLSPQVNLHRRQLVDIKDEMSRYLVEAERGETPEAAALITRLRNEMDAYWKALQPILDESAADKRSSDPTFLRDHVLPHRDAIIQLAHEIREFNQASFRREGEKVHQSQQKFLRFLVTLGAVALALGLVVAALGIFRISRLEARADEHQQQTEQTEEELRRLSQELVRAQEDERRAISRELHDEVGQMLTALRMELSNLGKLRIAGGHQFQEHLEASRRIAVQALNTVRDLAMGLRPSILDDLGLGPALEWQAREFSRRSSVLVSVDIQGNLERLSDLHSTGVYRIVQEALTNCAKHAQARTIEVRLKGDADELSLIVRDDGVGFDPRTVPSRGLGLIGIEERVREMHGKLKVSSKLGNGTHLHVSIPLLQEAPL